LLFQIPPNYWIPVMRPRPARVGEMCCLLIYEQAVYGSTYFFSCETRWQLATQAGDSGTSNIREDRQMISSVSM